MFKVERKRVEVDVGIDVICNVCGESTVSDGIFEYAVITAEWGYGSNRDGEEWRAHACEGCMVDFMDSWVFPPERRDYMDRRTMAFRSPTYIDHPGNCGTSDGCGDECGVEDHAKTKCCNVCRKSDS